MPSKPGNEPATSEPRRNGVTPMTCMRPSLAMWRSVGTHASELSHVGVVDGEAGSSPHPPDQALTAGRHELAMRPEHAAVWPEVEERVVDGGPVRVALVDADGDVRVGASGGLAESVRRGTRDHDRLLL